MAAQSFTIKAMILMNSHRQFELRRSVHQNIQSDQMPTHVSLVGYALVAAIATLFIFCAWVGKVSGNAIAGLLSGGCVVVFITNTFELMHGFKSAYQTLTSLLSMNTGGEEPSLRPCKCGDDQQHILSC